MLHAGEILKKAREDRGISLEEVSKATKIQEKFLRALEEGNYSVLPNEVYTRGFVRNYAQFLGLDIEKITAFFRREFVKREKLTARTPPQPVEKSWLRVTPGFIISSLATLSVLIFLGFLFWQYHSFAGAPVLILERPQKNFVTENSSVEVVGRTDPQAQVLINGQAIQVESNGVFSVIVGLNAGLNRIRVVARNQVGKETIEERNVEAKISELVAGQKSEGPPQSSAKEQNLILKVQITSSSAWLQIFTDGMETFRGILMPGVEQTFEASEEITVKTGNAGSTRLFLNGVEQEKLGEEGEVVEKIFKQE